MRPSICSARSYSRSFLLLGVIGALPPVALAAPKKLATVEGITEYALDNGMQVLLFPDQSKPTVTVNVTYRVGSRHEGRGEAGMAHLLEHMLFKGTPTYQNIWGALEDHGASFNGTTWLDRTNYFETLNATDANLEFALKMEADRMVNSTISGEELAKEMTVVRNEFEMGENNPVGVMSERMMSAAFLWHNYGKSTIGNRSDIERVPVENLRRFYQKYYQPDNATLLVAGKFDVDKTLGLIEKHFGSIPKPDRVLENTYTEEPAQDGARLVTLNRVGDVAAAGLVYHIPSGTHAEYPAVQVLESVLTDQPSGKLYKALVETGLATSISGSAYALAEPGVIELMARVAPEHNAREVLDKMIEAVETAAESGIEEEDVERIKTRAAKDFKLGMTNSGRVGVRLSESIAQGDWRLFFLHRDRLKNVAVADVQQAAGKYLIESNRTAGLFIPSNSPMRATVPPAPDVMELVKDYKGEEGIAEGESFVATPQSIEERTKRITLPSGIKLALMPLKSRGEKVQASFQFHFGTEQDMVGNTTAVGLIPSLMMRGTTDKNYQQLRDAIDQLQSRVSVGGFGRRGGGLDSVSASIESDTKNFKACVELLGEIMQKPAFDSKEFQVVVDQMLSFMEQGLSDPRAKGMNALMRSMSPWPAESVHYVPTQEEQIERLKAVSLGTVKDLYSRLYGASNLEVAIVGDFEEEAVTNAIESVFGSWKSPSKYARIDTPYREPKTEQLVIHTPDKEMAVVAMGTVFQLRDDDPDYAALEMASYVLGESAKSRLLNRLRHEGGLSYGAGASFNADEIEKRASLLGNAICAPQNAEKALEAMREEMQKWIAEGITEAELAEAKASYALKFKNRLANDRFVLGVLVGGFETNRTFEYYAKLLADIENLKREDVQKALKKHLGDLRFVELKAGDLETEPTEVEEKKAEVPESDVS